jgi:hypothetical protein
MSKTIGLSLFQTKKKDLFQLLKKCFLKLFISTVATILQTTLQLATLVNASLYFGLVQEQRQRRHLKFYLQHCLFSLLKQLNMLITYYIKLRHSKCKHYYT